MNLKGWIVVLSDSIERATLTRFVDLKGERFCVEPEARITSKFLSKTKQRDSHKASLSGRR